MSSYESDPRFAKLAQVVAILIALVPSAESYAQNACSFPAGTEEAAARANWSFSPPGICPDQPAHGSSSPTPTVSPTLRIKGTGDAPAKIPYLRHEAGGDPVLGDGEFVEVRTDAVLAGYGIHYEFTRTYRSRVNFTGVLGFGWDHNYNQRVIPIVQSNTDIPCEKTVDFQDGALNRVHFTYAYTTLINDISYDYYTSPSITYVLTSYVDINSGVQHWSKHDNDGIVSNFTSDGYLATIADPAGNNLSFTWEKDPFAGYVAVDGPALRLISVSDAARTVHYIYSGRGLQCITLGTDCTANENLLAGFNYQAAPEVNPIPHVPFVQEFELTSVTHGTDKKGEQYQYLDQLPDAVQRLALNVTPPDCLPSAELENYCVTFCEPPAAGAACNNANMGKTLDQFCSASVCVQYSPDTFCAFPGPTSDNPRCYSDENDFCTLLSGSTEPDASGKYTPCCEYSAPNNQLCWQYYNLLPDCVPGCEARYQCHESPAGQASAAFYSFGALDDLRHNIVNVYDENGQLVAANTYGQDPARVDFDKVVSQQLGSATADNVITFEYHDLSIEAGTVYNPTFDPASAAWPLKYSTPNSIVVNHFSAGETVWNPRQLCPSSCNVDDGCSAQTFLPSAFDASGGLQNAMSAIVVNELHGRTRVQYLDSQLRIVREVRTDTGETTDYNYDSNGLLQAVGAASGVRTCMWNDQFGRTLQTSIMPADGFAGNTTPLTTVYTYDGFGRVSNITVDPLGSPSTTVISRDPATALVTEVDRDVGPGKPIQTTYYRYNGEQSVGVLEMPTQIQYPNGRIDIFSDFDSSMGGPKTSIIDSTSAVPEQRFAVYDARGRLTDTGECATGAFSGSTHCLNRYAEHYTFDGGGRLSVVSHQMDASSPWIATTTSYRDATGTPKIDSIAEPLKTTSYNYLGQYPNQQNVTATSAPAGTSLPATQTTCFNYSADGRLEDVALPEGNSLHYQYYFGKDGVFVLTSKGFSGASSSAWNANCPSGQPLSGDPGIMLPTSGQEYLPGGFPLATVNGDTTRGYVDDGFGHIIQSDNNYQILVTPVDQYGYDVRGRVIWHAVYASGYGISTDPSVTGTPYHNPPQLNDAGLQSFTQYEYDFLNRKVKEHHWVIDTGEDLLTQNDYDDKNAKLTVTDRGVATIFGYDGRGRLINTTLPDTSVTTIQHFIGYDIVAIPTNQGTVINRTRRYDTVGRLLETDDENGVPLSSATYDDNGNVLTSTPAGSGTTTNYYDSFDRLVTSAQDLGTQIATEQYSWDRNNRVYNYQDANLNVWKSTFTGYDSQLTITDPLNRTGHYIYAPGFLTVAGMSEPNGRQSSFQYNTDMQVTDVFEGLCSGRYDIRFDACTPLQTRRHYDYTADEKHIALASVPAVGPTIPAQATVTQTYDSVQRPVEETVGDSVVHHGYTDAGRTVTTQLIYASVQTAAMTHHFDSMGRLGAVDLNTQTIARWDYGVGVGGPIGLTYSNGASTAYKYDSRLRQTRMDVTFNGSAGATPIASLYDVFGRDSVPRMRQRTIGSGPPMTDVYTVDSAGRMSAENLRLAGVTLLTGEISNSNVASYMQSGAASTYALDAIGNITNKNGTSFVNDALSRLQSVDGVGVKIDGQDNLQAAGADTAQFVFDEFTGNITGAAIPGHDIIDAGGSPDVTYDYDALDRRMVEHGPSGSEELFVWDGNQLIAHGSAGSLVLEVPSDDIDGHVASVDGLGSATPRFYHQGADQSVLAISDSQGLVEGYAYSSFGEVFIWGSSGNSLSRSSIDNRFLFQGQIYDPSTATYSMRARQYQPKWERFISPDPLSIAAAPSQYSFTGGMPLSHRDPLGLQTCVGLVCAGVDMSVTATQTAPEPTGDVGPGNRIYETTLELTPGGEPPPGQQTGNDEYAHAGPGSTPTPNMGGPIRGPGGVHSTPHNNKPSPAIFLGYLADSFKNLFLNTFDMGKTFVATSLQGGCGCDSIPWMNDRMRARERALDQSLAESLEESAAKTPVSTGASAAPKVGGAPNSIYEQVGPNGKVMSRTFYDANGNAFSRQDFDHSHYPIDGAHEHLVEFNEQGWPISVRKLISLLPGYFNLPTP